MPFFRTQVVDDELADRIDFNRTNESAWGNLKFALASILLPPGTEGVLRGLLVEPNSPEGMSVLLGPGAAFNAAGEFLVQEGTSICNIAAAHPTLPRIDLISINVVEEETSLEERLFINDSVEPAVTFTDVTNTQRRVTVTPVVTTGTAAGLPVPPATPAGNVAIATVRVEAAATSIGADKVSRAGTPPVVDADRLKLVTFPGAGSAPIGPPYLTNGIGGSIVVPPASVTFLFAAVYLQANAGLAALDFTIQTVGAGVIVARHRARVDTEGTIFFGGVRIGGVRSETYEIRISNNGDALPTQHAAILLPTAYLGSGGVVTNFLGAVSI